MRPCTVRNGSNYVNFSLGGISLNGSHSTTWNWDKTLFSLLIRISRIDKALKEKVVATWNGEVMDEINHDSFRSFLYLIDGRLQRREDDRLSFNRTALEIMDSTFEASPIKMSEMARLSACEKVFWEKVWAEREKRYLPVQKEFEQVAIAIHSHDSVPLIDVNGDLYLLCDSTV